MKTETAPAQSQKLADFRPFRAFRYDMSRVQAKDVLAPPYDVISPAEQEALYQRSPYNCIRLILNKILESDTDADNRYTRARDFFSKWKSEGILKKEEKQQEQKFVPKSYVLFNVDTFNTWFNDKDNGAEYAHSGIFLRLDKLSENHLIDYFKKCHNIDNYVCIK